MSKSNESSGTPELKISLSMPRILIQEDSEQEAYAADRLMRALGGACAYMVQKNYAAQECMDMVNFIYQRDGVLHIAFNHDQPIDLDHFRMAIVTVLSAVESEAGAQRVSIVAPMDFKELIKDYEQINPED